jgi:hypothetical protein
MSRRTAALFLFFPLLTAACGTPTEPGSTGATSPRVTAKVVDYYAAGRPPAAGIDVVFSDPGGAVLGQTKTDATGMASFDVAAGSRTTVTVVARSAYDPAYAVLQTVMGAEPGDVLPFGVTLAPIPASPTVGTVAVHFPAAPRAASTYSLNLPCSAGFGFWKADTTFAVTQNCLRTGTTLLDITADALDGDGNTRAYAVQTDVAVAPTGETAVDFPGGWRTDFANFTASYVNVPADGQLNSNLCLQRFDQTTWCHSASSAVPGGQPGAWSQPYPQGYATGLEVWTGFTRADATQGEQLIIRRVSGTPEGITFDLATALPALGGKVFDTSTPRPSVAWTAAGDLSGADFGRLQLLWGNYTGAWYVLFPPTAASPLRLPELPASLAQFAPPANGDVRLFQFAFEESSALADYRAARTTFEGINARPADATIRQTYLP